MMIQQALQVVETVKTVYNVCVAVRQFVNYLDGETRPVQEALSMDIVQEYVQEYGRSSDKSLVVNVDRQDISRPRLRDRRKPLRRTRTSLYRKIKTKFQNRGISKPQYPCRNGSVLIFVTVSEADFCDHLAEIINTVIVSLREDYVESNSEEKELYEITIEHEFDCLQTLYEMSAQEKEVAFRKYYSYISIHGASNAQTAEVVSSKYQIEGNVSQILISPQILDLPQLPVDDCLYQLFRQFEFEDGIPPCQIPLKKKSLKRKAGVVEDLVAAIKKSTKKSEILHKLLDIGILKREDAHKERLFLQTYSKQLQDLRDVDAAFAWSLVDGKKHAPEKKKASNQPTEIFFHGWVRKSNKSQVRSNAFVFGGVKRQGPQVPMGIEDLLQELNELTDHHQLHSFVNINDVLLDDNFVENFVENSITDCLPALPDKNIFRSEVPVSAVSVYTGPIHFHELLLLLESLANDIGSPKSWATDLNGEISFLNSIKLDSKRLATVDLTEIMQSFFADFLHLPSNEIFVLERRDQSGKDSIFMIFRKFPTETNDSTLKVSVLFACEKEKQPDVKPLQEISSFPLILELCTEPENTIDTVEAHIAERTYEHVLRIFKESFSQLTENTYAIFVNDEEVHSSENLIRFWDNHSIPTFRIKRQAPDVAIPVAPSPVSGTTVAFPSQILVAGELRDRSKKILNERINSFNKLDFLIFVPKYNTLKQQTIDRLAKFDSFIDGMSENDLSERVLLYPVQDKAKSKVQSFADRITSEPTTLFLIIVDECHFAPTSNAIPLLHNSDVVGRENVLVLLVSATPYNVLSNKSKIEKSNVIDWMETLKGKMKKDTYIGFEYYARSIAFDCADPKFTVEHGQQQWEIALNSNREYATFNALAEAINFQLNAHGLSMISFGYNRNIETPRFEISLHTNRRGEEEFRLSGDFLVELGFPSEQPLILNQQSKIVCASSSITINEDSSPLDSQLIRTDASFSEVRGLLEKGFPYLKNARGGLDDLVDGEADGPVAKGKKKLKSTLRKDSLTFQAFIDLQCGAEDLSNEKHSNPAAARNGFIIVLDYIFSICFYAVAYKNHSLQEPPSSYREMAKKYIQYIYKTCSYDNNSEFFNLTFEAQSILREMVNVAKEEMKTPISDVYDVLAYILEQKRSSIGVITADTEVWYTETDRIVAKLLNPKSPAMVLLRCYDNDENRSMQKILREALRVCELFEEGSTSTPACSVIGDISRTRIIETIEPEYRKKVVQHPMFGECRIEDIPKLRAKALVGNACTNAVKISDDLKYEDLNGVRCLLILCEKGRMGDTFPPSLSVLDFRLRTCGNSAGFIQELGRMCRYPIYDKQAAECIHHHELVEYCERLDETNDFSTDGKYLHGCLVMLLDEECVGLARNTYQLRKLLRGLSSVPITKENQQITLYPLSSSLPYALIDKDYIKAIEKAIDTREELILREERTNPMEIEKLRDQRENRILWSFSSPGSLDTYLDQKYKRISDAFNYTFTKTSKHYDLMNEEQRNIFSRNRLLLQAECQIGKTGAFLAFLSLMNDELRQNVAPELPPISRDLVTRTQQSAHIPGYRWYLPYWKSLADQAAIRYSLPKVGKYHETILVGRAVCLAQALSQGSDGAGNVITLLEKYKRALKERLCILFTPREEEELNRLQSFDEAEPDYFSRLLNWDGRMDLKHDLLQQYQQLLLDQNQIKSVLRQMNRTDYSEYSHREMDPTIMLNDEEEQIQIKDGQPDILSCVQQVTLHSEPQGWVSALSLLHAPRIGGLTTISEKYIGINELKYRISVPLLAILGEQDSTFIFKRPNIIRNWIFTASYAGRSNLTEKLLVRKDCFRDLVPWDDYFQVLVVRESQYEDYKKNFGQDYIVIGMPESMMIPFSGEIGQGHIPCKRYTAHQGGIGLTRRFIQYIARYSFDQSQIWMLDDDIKDCYQLTVPRDHSRPFTPTYQNVSFAEVMKSIEQIISPTHDQSTNHTNLSDLQLIQSENKESYYRAPDVLLRSNESMIPEVSLGNNRETIRNLSDFVGHHQQYGIIGINRCLTQRQVIEEPIKVTHSIYSFFLLNLTALEDHQLYYSPRPIWEDVEMNHMIERKGLLCCKLQVFVCRKPSRGLMKPSQLPPLPPPLPNFPHNYTDWFTSNIVDNPYFGSSNPQLQDVKSIIEASLRNLPVRMADGTNSDEEKKVLISHATTIDIGISLHFELQSLSRIPNRILIIVGSDTKCSFPEQGVITVTSQISYTIEDDGIVDQKYHIFKLTKY